MAVAGAQISSYFFTEVNPVAKSKSHMEPKVKQSQICPSIVTSRAHLHKFLSNLLIQSSEIYKILILTVKAIQIHSNTNSWICSVDK